MRGKLIHASEPVDVELVVKTVLERIPKLEPRIRARLSRLTGPR
jgi:uncharacterized protein with HEPN domain